MSPKILSIFQKVLFILSVVNARTVLQNVKTQLPGTELQKETLATSVCNDLEMTIKHRVSQTECRNSFWRPIMESVGIQRPEVSAMRCRSHKTLQLEVTPSHRWQLVVLIPETPEEDSIINYSLIEPETTSSEIVVSTTTRKYIIFATMINEDGHPFLWHAQDEVPALSDAVTEHYAVQVQFVNYNITDADEVTGVVRWNHTGDSKVCFEVINSCKGGEFKEDKILWPDQDAKFIIEKLPLDDECDIKVTSIYGSTKMSYHTPAQRTESKHRSKNSVVIDVPKDKIRPKIPEDISVVAIEDGDAWKIRVGWARPRYPPERYNVTVLAGVNASMILPGNATEAIFFGVSGVTGKEVYTVTLDAFKNRFRAHARRRAVFPVRSRREWRWAGAAAGAWAAAALGVLALALCARALRHALHSARKPPSQESKPLDEGLESVETEPCEDQWEVKSERLLLHEVIGEGAFGVVRRGKLAPTGKEVAVKMLKEFPSAEEVRAFRLEMELMKSVGAHAHVVSLVGCCSGKRPLIVAEYCARGDLLSFLRFSWDVMVSKRNASYYNNNINTSDYRNDLFKCKIQREHSKLVVNKMYDLQSLCDSDLTSLDLLSFCRQIAMGMEFLATNKLVHRDLAARNVLVTSDKTLKIADFGLSRDVYEENQYKQKGNGKMPVKWMAPESLTRRIYSSQSDVWSFGVVVWEVVTVGGAPYPEVPAARLPRLLRAGYRMPRPPNCSKQLYELMQCCWRAHPRERPSFPELHRRLDELLNCACADHYLCLELDDAPPPAPRAQRYFRMIMRGKRAWTRESYERPLKAIQGNHNHYTSPPVTLTKAPA